MLSFQIYFVNENFGIFCQIPFNFVQIGSIDIKTALVLVTAWRRTGENLSSGPFY